MSRKAQSADGIVHEFPDNTPDEVIDRAMADYAKQQGSSAQSKPAPNPFSGKTQAELRKAYVNSQFLGNKEALPLIADAFVEGEAKEGGFGFALDDVIRQAAKGVPILGAGLDELSAKTSELMGGNYEETLDYQRARDRFRETQNPETSTAVQLAGGIGGTLAGARALGVGGFGVNSPWSLAQRTIAGGTAGLPIGATDGFLRGEGDAESRTTDAAVGGLLGLGTGAIAPVVGQGLSSGYEAIANLLSRNASLRGLGLSRPVAEEIIDRLSPDELGAQGAARIRSGGPDAMVADVGPNAAGMLDATIQKGGPGAQMASAAIEQRARNANQQLRGTLDTTFGPAQGVASRQEAIRQGTSAARGKAYTTAYDRPIDYAAPEGQHIESLLPRIPGRALTYANELMKAEGNASKQIKVTLNPDGTVAFEKMPDVRQLDYITRALNDVAKGADGQGALGGQTAVGRAYGSLSQEIRQTMRAAVPEYGQALDTAADPIRRIQAIDFGSMLLNPKVTRGAVADELQGMSQAERKAVLEGLRDNLDEIASNVKEMASDPNVDARQLREVLKGLTSPAAREKVSLALGDVNKSLQFFKQVGQASRALELKAQVATNSRTAARQETIRGMDERLRPGIVRTALEGDIPSATKKVIATLTGATPRQSRLRNNEQWREMAEALTTRRGRTAELFLRQLQAAARARAANSAVGQNLGVAGAGTVAGSQPTLRGAVPIR